MTTNWAQGLAGWIRLHDEQLITEEEQPRKKASILRGYTPQRKIPYTRHQNSRQSLNLSYIQIREAQQVVEDNNTRPPRASEMRASKTIHRSTSVPQYRVSVIT